MLEWLLPEWWGLLRAVIRLHENGDPELLVAMPEAPALIVCDGPVQDLETHGQSSSGSPTNTTIIIERSEVVWFFWTGPIVNL